MINIVFCIKSPESFSRIYNAFKDDNNFELEDFIENFEKVQENITVRQYELAVVDEKLSWKDSALDLFNKKDIKIVIFKGDFRKTISDIYKLFPVQGRLKNSLKRENPSQNMGKQATSR